MQESRTRRTLRNSFVAMSFFVVDFILQFFSRKIFLDYLGTEILGLNTTAINILQFISLAELGLGSVMGFALYRPIYEDNKESISEIMALQKILYRRIAFGIIGISLVVMCFFPYIFKKMELPLWYAYATFGALLFSSMLGYFYNYKSIVVSASQMDYKLHLANRPLDVIKTILQIIAVAYSPYPYISWLLLQVAFSIIITCSIQRVTFKNFPYLRETQTFSYDVLKTKYSFVLEKMKQTFFHKFAAVVLQRSSPLIIYGYITLTMVAIYGNYTVIVNGLSQLIGSVFNSMGAGIGNLIAEGNQEKILRVFGELFSIRFAIAFFFAFGVFILSQPFISNWVGHEYLLPTGTVGLISILFFINISRNTVDLFLGTQGICKDIWAAILEICLNLGGSIVLGYFFGLNGIISGVILSLVIIVLIWKPIFLFREGFKVSVFIYVKLYIAHIVIALFVSGVVVWVCGLIEISPYDGWKSLILYAICVMGLFFVMYSVALYITMPGIRDFVKRIKSI